MYSTSCTRLAAALLLTAVAPAAAQRTDVVTLRNGDRVTGEVEQLERGQLRLRTYDMGTVHIDWGRVASVTAAKWFDVTTEDGWHHYGSLRPGAAGAGIEVVGGLETVALEVLSIIRIAPLRSSFWRRIDGTLDVGFRHTQANQLTTLELDLDARYRTRKFMLGLRADSTLTRQEELEDADRHVLGLRYFRLSSPKWHWLALGRVESHRQLGYDLRSTGGAGFGRFLVQSNRRLLSAAVGASVNREVPVGEDPSESNVDAFVMLQYADFTYSFPNTRIEATLVVLPSLTAWGRVRGELDVALRHDLFRDFTVSLGVVDNYDSQPPGQDADQDAGQDADQKPQTNDLEVSFSIGWRF